MEADIEVHVNDKAVLEQEMKRFENEKNEMALDLASVQQTKGQIKSQWIYKIIDFPNCQFKTVYLKLNQKTLSTHDKPSLNMQKTNWVKLSYI